MCKYIKNYWFLVLFLAVFVAGCSDGQHRSVIAVIATHPANSDVGVPISSNVTATFNTAMNPSTITTATFTVQDGTTPIAGTVTYAGTTATFIPAGTLATNTTFTATITTGVHDIAGQTLASNKVWTFKTAVTAPTQYSLVVTAVNGSVTQSLDQATYNDGTVATLTASPATGYHFTGWSGDLSGATNPAQITMTGNKTVTANFALDTYTLTITAVNGSVTKSLDQTTYDAGTVVTLTANPATDYAFTGWSGDLSGATNPAHITMTGDKTVTANFTNLGNLEVGVE